MSLTSNNIYGPRQEGAVGYVPRFAIFTSTWSERLFLKARTLDLVTEVLTSATGCAQNREVSA